MNVVILAILGLVMGHAIRRMTPYFLNLKDTSLPFSLPWLEVLTGAAFLWVGLERGFAPSQWKWYIFCLFLLTVVATDQLTKYIPDKVCYGGAVVGLLTAWLFPQDILLSLNQVGLLDRVGFPVESTKITGLVLSILGAAMGFLQMEFIRKIFKPMVKMEVMGFGDSLLMLMIGAYLGPKTVLFALLPACLFGVLMGAIWQVIFKAPHFPFGPSLALGSFIMSLHGSWILTRIGSFHEWLYELPPWALLAFSLFLVFLLLYLILRLKKKAAAYQRIIEEDYQEIDKKMKK